jgi:CheY-like chemotaxis protein
VELLRASLHLADRLPRPPSEFYLSEGDVEGNSVTQLRVLVVDDERLLADTTADILRRAGFTAKIAYDGFGALEMIASFHPDYLLTDIMMPGMNGVELAIATTRIHPSTKIMLFSGQAGISEILEDSKAKGFEFPLLAKPVHPTKLVEGLKRLKTD